MTLKYRDSAPLKYEPGQPDWLGFRDLASIVTLFFVKISMRSYEKPIGPATDISIFATEISDPVQVIETKLF